MRARMQTSTSTAVRSWLLLPLRNWHREQNNLGQCWGNFQEGHYPGTQPCMLLCRKDLEPDFRCKAGECAIIPPFQGSPFKQHYLSCCLSSWHPTLESYRSATELCWENLEPFLTQSTPHPFLVFFVRATSPKCSSSCDYAIEDVPAPLAAAEERVAAEGQHFQDDLLWDWQGSDFNVGRPDMQVHVATLDQNMCATQTPLILQQLLRMRRIQV